MTALGFELFNEPKAGLYLWARHPDISRQHRAVAARRAAPGMMLGPGHLFLVEPRPTGWLRFNVAFSEDERIFRFLSDQIQRSGGGSTA